MTVREEQELLSCESNVIDDREEYFYGFVPEEILDKPVDFVRVMGGKAYIYTEVD